MVVFMGLNTLMHLSAMLFQRLLPPFGLQIVAREHFPITIQRDGRGGQLRAQLALLLLLAPPDHQHKRPREQTGLQRGQGQGRRRQRQQEGQQQGVLGQGRGGQGARSHLGEPQERDELLLQVRERLHYATKTCDIRSMAV